ncbi:MAG TPA: OB-fold domain-containing protein [Kribbella sp.]|nr:OB-fold domain-containing protein [Amycolatopsis sp.]HWD77323.1 OB-fold domain-containing protein [Kribbella sp.]
MAQQIPIVDYLVLGDPAHLEAHQCTSCSALYFDRRNACAKCGGTEFGRRALSNDGQVRAFTIVHRAAPSVPAPYTSVVVDLDGGGTVKANLLDTTDPDGITPGLPVTLDTFVAGTDDDGVEAIGFGYRKRKENA